MFLEGDLIMEGGRHGLFGKDNWRISGHLNGDFLQQDSSMSRIKVEDFVH